MPAARLALFAALLLTGCDAFNPTEIPIPFRVVADTTIALSASIDLRAGGGIRLLRSQDEADAFRTQFNIPGAVPDVDWSRESVFVIIDRFNNNWHLVVTDIALLGVESVMYTYEQRASGASATGLHTVLVAVATERIAEDYGVAVMGNGLQPGP